MEAYDFPCIGYGIVSWSKVCLTGTSLQLWLTQGVFSNANDFYLSHEPPYALQAQSSSAMPRLQNWSINSCKCSSSTLIFSLKWRHISQVFTYFYAIQIIFNHPAMSYYCLSGQNCVARCKLNWICLQGTSMQSRYRRRAFIYLFAS